MSGMMQSEYRITPAIWQGLVEELKRREHLFEWEASEEVVRETLGRIAGASLILYLDGSSRMVINWVANTAGPDKKLSMKRALEIEAAAMALGAECCWALWRKQRKSRISGETGGFGDT